MLVVMIVVDNDVTVVILHPLLLSWVFDKPEKVMYQLMVECGVVLGMLA